MRNFTDNDAKLFMMKYISEDKQGFSILISVQYVNTVGGIAETCGGCTIHDGQECSTPTHYIDEFLVVCKKELNFGGKTID